MLDERKAAILRALVEGYIRTGEAVSSRAILDHSDLTCSSATVRNELMVLEREGYIMKPHTSAGRIPTDRGYRYYVDNMSPGALQHSTHTRIERFYASMHAELNRMLKQTSALLSEITHYPSVVVGPGVRGQTVSDTHLLPVGPDAVLLVIVTEKGRVTQSLLRIPMAVSPAEVSIAEEALDGIVAGLEMAETVVEALDNSEFDLPAPAAAVLEQAAHALVEAARSDREVFLGGTSLMATLWEDLAKLHRILALLEREASVLALVGESQKETMVRFGSEIHAGEDDLAIVSTPYGDTGSGGRMGVFGPMRMDYKRTIKVVEEVSDALGGSLGD
jgi:heat-inducible transcriptional repressor